MQCTLVKMIRTLFGYEIEYFQGPEFDCIDNYLWLIVNTQSTPHSTSKSCPSDGEKLSDTK